MNTHTNPLTRLLISLLAAAAVLAACGSPTPIAVYVTPTRSAAQDTAVALADAASVMPAPVIPPTATEAPTDPPSATAAPTETALPATASPTAPAVAVQATQTIAPGVTFGAIIGPDYTPEPLHTALPSTVSVRPCTAFILAPQATLYASPDAAAQAAGTAAERTHPTVSAVQTDDAGQTWAQTPQGWLLISDQTAQFDSLRACDILRGLTPQTTLLGLHVLNESDTDEALALVRRMKQSGYPLSTVKGLNGTEEFLQQVKQISPETVTVYRSLLAFDFPEGNCPAQPGQYGDPVETAGRWYRALLPFWDTAKADYFEYMNECPAALDWISDFSIEMMRLANADQKCLLLFSFPGGNPTLEDFDKLLPALRYAAENECQPGRHPGMALHAWSITDTGLISESDVWVALRHRIFHQRLLDVLPEAANLPVYLTEVGTGGGTLMPDCQTIIRDALQFTYQLEEDPYVKGFHLWNVGTGGQWYDISPCLEDLGTALLAYYKPG